jgi:uncharacterized protein DUF4241
VLRAGALVLLVAALAACRGGEDEPSAAVDVTGVNDGLSLAATVRAEGDSLVVDARLRNGRAHGVHVYTDQCGRVTEAFLARTKFEPVGRRWHGSLAEAKRRVLNGQRYAQWPDRFAPRIPGETSSDPPPCVRPDRPRALRPGQVVAERWELPLSGSRAMAEVGSAATVVRVDAVEAEAPDDLHYLDILPTPYADSVPAAQAVRVAQPAAAVLDRAPTDPQNDPSLGQLYDRMVQDATLRRWIASQPAESWRQADLAPTYSGDRLRLHLVTAGYERAAVATARLDGTGVHDELPAGADRARVFPRRPATLPAGIRLIPEEEGWEPTKDVLPGSLELPSGRIVVTEYADWKPLALRVKPGRYPAYATLATYEHKLESVALATLVLSPAETVRWKRIGAVSVDGGTTSFYSAESAARMRREQSPEQPDSAFNRIGDSLSAHDYLVTNYDLAPRLNLIQFASGNGDGGYPILAGYDEAGHPTRIVVDFYLLHLDWPGSS